MSESAFNPNAPTASGGPLDKSTFPIRWHGHQVHRLAKEVEEGVARARAGNVENIDSLKRTIDTALSEISALGQALRDLSSRVGRLQKRRLLRDRFTPDWWEARRKQIAETQRENWNAGFTLWLSTFAEVLIAWRLDDCIRLLDDSQIAPSPNGRMHVYLRAGIQALLEKRFDDADVLEMIDYLLTGKDGDTSYVIGAGERAAVLVFRGRIEQRMDPSLDQALASFEEAARLAPDQALPLIGLGEHKLASDLTSDADAHFRQALDLDPDEPHAYAGLGAVAESTKNWSKADEFFDRAVECASGVDPDPKRALEALLAPVDPRLIIRLAAAQSKTDAERALATADEAIALETIPEAYLLKGQILLTLKRAGDAAAALYEAGRGFSRDGRQEEARDAFLSAMELQGPELTERYLATSWELADTWMALSLKARLPEEKAEAEEALNQGARLWDATIRRSLPGYDHYWVYLTRAMLAERAATLGAGDWRTKTSSLLQAIALVERSLLRYEERALSWALLARYYGKLGLELTALAASERAMQYASTDRRTAMDERLIILVNSGEWEAAQKIIDESSKEPDVANQDWLRCVGAFIEYCKGNYSRALEQIPSLVKPEFGDVWILEMRANCNQMAGETQKAADDWEAIQSLAEGAEGNDAQGALAAVALNRGDYQRAIELAGTRLDDPLERGYIGQVLLAAFLRTNRFDEAEELVPKLVEWSTARMLSTWRIYYLKPMQPAIPADRYGRIESAILNKINDAPGAADQELADAEELFGVDREDSWEWTGLNATRARTYSARGSHNDAAAIYERLARVHVEGMALFPEARAALAKQTPAIIDEADGCLLTGRPEQAISQYLRAIAYEREAEESGSAGVAPIFARLGCARFKSGDLPNAKESVLAALSWGDASAEDAATAAADSIGPLITGIGEFFRFQDLLQRWEAEVGVEQRHGVQILRTKLIATLNTRSTLRDPGGQIQTGAAIAVELSRDLLTQGGPDLRTLGARISEMRRRLWDEFGVRLPGIKVRMMRDPARRSSYAILFHETPLPFEAAPGGSDLIALIAGRLETELRRNMADLIGFQDTQNMLDEWRQDDRLRPIIEAKLSMSSSKLRLTQLLRRMVEQGLPLSKSQEILESIGGTGAELNDDEWLRAVRLRLKDQLPGNRNGDTRIDLPTELEEDLWVWLWWDARRHYLAAPAETASQWRDELAKIIEPMRPAQERGSVLALVVREAELRQPLHEFVKLHFAGVAVLAREELIGELRPSSASGVPAHG